MLVPEGFRKSSSDTPDNYKGSSLNYNTATVFMNWANSVCKVTDCEPGDKGSILGRSRNSVRIP